MGTFMGVQHPVVLPTPPHGWRELPAKHGAPQGSGWGGIETKPPTACPLRSPEPLGGLPTTVTTWHSLCYSSMEKQATQHGHVQCSHTRAQVTYLAMR